MILAYYTQRNIDKVRVSGLHLTVPPADKNTAIKNDKFPTLEGGYKTVQLVCIGPEVFKELDRAMDKLSALEAHGVDNWSGYDDAMEGLEDE